MRKDNKSKGGENVHLEAENQLQKYKRVNSVTKNSTAEINLRLIAECNRNMSRRCDTAAKKVIVALG